MQKNYLGAIIGISLLCLSGSASSEDNKAERNVRKEFLEDCLATSDDKYELYKNCIGKFSKVCEVELGDKFDEVLKDISVGPLYRNCVEREAIWWDELFKEYSEQLKNKVEDKSILKVLEEELIILNNRSRVECGYVTVQYGFRGDGLVQTAGRNQEFKCRRDAQAETAITIYLWSEYLDVLRGVK